MGQESGTAKLGGSSSEALWTCRQGSADAAVFGDLIVLGLEQLLLSSSHGCGWEASVSHNSGLSLRLPMTRPLQEPLTDPWDKEYKQVRDQPCWKPIFLYSQHHFFHNWQVTQHNLGAMWVEWHKESGLLQVILKDAHHGLHAENWPETPDRVCTGNSFEVHFGFVGIFLEKG